MKLQFRPRFSLRALLLLFTALAVWIGLHASQAHKQRVAVDAVIEHGGSVYYDYQLREHGTRVKVPAGRVVSNRGVVGTFVPGTIVVANERRSYFLDRIDPSQLMVPAWLVNLVGQDMIVKVIAVHLEDTDVTDEELQILAGLPDVRVVNLSHTQITDHGLAHLSRLRKLEELVLDGTRINGPGLAHIENLPRLEVLGLAGSGVHDDGLAGISAPKALRSLNLAYTSVSNSGFSYLRSADALRRLSVEHSSLDDAGLEVLKQLKSLEVLRLPPPYNRWLAHRNSNVSADVLREIERALPNTQISYPRPSRLSKYKHPLLVSGTR